MGYKVTIKYINKEKKKHFIVVDENVSTYIKSKFPDETFLDTRIKRVISSGDQVGLEVDMVFSSEEVYNQIMSEPIVISRMNEFNAYNVANNIVVTITGVVT